MRFDPIHKDPAHFKRKPNLIDYEATCREFSWDKARDELTGLPDGGGLNIAFEAVDRHVLAGVGSKTAIRFIQPDLSVLEVSYAELKSASDRFANALRDHGVGRGDVVFSLMPRLPEFYVGALGTLKNGSVFSPLFSAFGPEPIHTRMERGEGKVLLTTPALYKRKVAQIRTLLPKLQCIVLCGSEAESNADAGVHSCESFMRATRSEFEIPPTNPEEYALLHFTSGTTGRPKGAIHVHAAVIAHHATGRYALDLHHDDIFWCTADPGWVTGMSYGLIAPLVHGVTMVVDEEEFDAERWYRILEEQQVSIWYTAPTAIRMLMKAGSELARSHDFPALRFMASVGEPLNPEAVVWGVEAFGMPFHDNWWQTETGGIMIANLPVMDIRPGSMGKPLPGVETAIVKRREGGRLDIITNPDEEGELALRPVWPSMFRGYMHEDERYAQCFMDGWYLTGDLARCDSDGYHWFVGRADDVIKSSGHLIGPFEVESALMEHPAVLEAAVIGKPDPVALETVKAFVTLKPGYEADEELKRELLGFARKHLGAAVAPREIDFIAGLPHTRSGKIMRRLLKARELGLPEGDISTLEQMP